MARIYVPNKTEKTIRKAIAHLETVKSSVESKRVKVELVKICRLLKEAIEGL